MLTKPSFTSVSFIVFILVGLFTLQASAHGPEIEVGVMNLTKSFPGCPAPEAAEAISNAGTYNQPGRKMDTIPSAESQDKMAPAPSLETLGVQQIGDAWVIDGVGSFSNRVVYTFTSDNFPDGLAKSDYTVHGRRRVTNPPIPWNHRYDPANVQTTDGMLTLTVPGGQIPRKRRDKAISCAEITTTERNILYASVRTNAIFSSVPGTCQGPYSIRAHHEVNIC